MSKINLNLKTDVKAKNEKYFKSYLPVNSVFIFKNIKLFSKLV